MSDPRFPWAAAAVMGVVFWLLEAALHSYHFGDRPYLVEVFYPQEHEAWMRSIVNVMALAVAAVWSWALRLRQRQVAELERYQARLREASARIVYGDVEERRELADRLHEHVGQTLAAARFFMAAVESEPPGDAARNALHSVERILDRAIVDCREIAEELSPPVLDEYGLEPALETLARRVMRQTGTSVEVDAANQAGPGLARETLLTAFQVLAEVVEAAAASPGTTTVRVSSTKSDSAISVAVRWDSSVATDFYMACEHLTRVGGSLERSVEPHSTTVTIRAPYAAA